MIERKPHKFSLNSSETNGLKLPKEDSSSFFSQQRNKTAAETATSILEEMGVNKSSKNESVKSNAENIARKSEIPDFGIRSVSSRQYRRFPRGRKLQ